MYIYVETGFSMVSNIFHCIYDLISYIFKNTVKQSGICTTTAGICETTKDKPILLHVIFVCLK